MCKKGTGGTCCTQITLSPVMALELPVSDQMISNKSFTTTPSIQRGLGKNIALKVHASMLR